LFLPHLPDGALGGTDGPARTGHGLPREFVQVFGIEAQFFENLVDAGGALLVVVTRDGHRDILRRFCLRRRECKTTDGYCEAQRKRVR
jgi:hypothetical protein